MIAKIICFLLGHVSADLHVCATPDPHVYVRRGTCARCGVQVFELFDLRDEE